MARKRYSDKGCLKILRQVELDLAAGGRSQHASINEAVRDIGFQYAEAPLRSHPIWTAPPSVSGCGWVAYV